MNNKTVLNLVTRDKLIMYSLTIFDVPGLDFRVERKVERKEVSRVGSRDV